MAVIRILAIVVGEDNTTFYKEDGSTIILPSNDPRIPGIVEVATPFITAGKPADVSFESITTTHYKNFEEKTGGIVKLFRVAKKWVKHLFEDEQDRQEAAEAAAKLEAQTIGTVPVVTNGQPAVPVEEPAPAPVAPVTEKSEKLTNAASEILSKAQSVNDETFTDDETKEDETIIAVVEQENGEALYIPGMEHLKDHFAAALKLGSTQGVENFLRRISTVIDKRGHSIGDLLKFMSRNDMPIADDGCLVAFKTLNRRGNHADVYQDIHSGNVIQRVGSKVFMAESLVDHDRRRDCSNGLHVARRAYVGGFRGSSGVMVLIKVAPEDAIAVPQYDANKMRVCGYHIVGDVPKDDHQKVFSNQPIPKDSATAKLLGAVLRGQHIGIIETVEIGGSRGGNLKITPVEREGEANRQKKVAVEQAKKAEPVASIDDDKDGVGVAKVDVKAVAEKVTEAKTGAVQSKAQEARALFVAGKYPELIAFKKAAKKGWHALGFNATEEAMILNSAKTAPTPAAEVKAEPVKEKAAPKAAPKAKKGTAAKAKSAPAVKTPEPVKEPKMEGTRAEVARKLYDQATGTGSAEGQPADKSRWGSLWRHQKECKKSWSILGFTAKEIERIKTNKPDWV